MEQRWRNARSITILFCFWLLVASNDASLGERIAHLVPSRGGAFSNTTEQEETESMCHDESILFPLINHSHTKSLEATTSDSIIKKTKQSTEDESEEMVYTESPLTSARTLERKRLQFFDRMAWVSEMWMRKEHDASLHSSNANLSAITPESDLRLPARHFHIVTTAALPWFTGTAVNPTLRAAYLHRKTQEINNSTDQWVTLVVPWLELPQDQKQLYGEIFSTQQEQEEYMRSWLRDKAGMPDAADPESGLRILFYPARYHSGLCSIFAMGDLLNLIEEKGGSMDVCILEEPEHVNWFRAPGDGWTIKYKFVVGIVHTSKSW
jgi:digalactosyldiacylglycerol synthase